MPAALRKWLITGVSSGLGEALAKAVLARGDTVVGTLRKPEQTADFEALAPGRAHALVLDLRDFAGVLEKVGEAARRLGGIDVLVNNAGYGLAGALEEVSEHEAREQMETNFFGALAATQAVLPGMRAQRWGHVVNITSMAGFMGIPGMPIYSASKFALEGLGAALAAEAGELGIRVTNVEPGALRTRWASGNAIVRSARVIEDYQQTAGAVRGGLAKMDGRQDGDPDKAALAIIAAVDAERAPLHLPIHPSAWNAFKSVLQTTSEQLDDWREVSESILYER
ncbi:SDR family NAD(P)-dependent oxidoreductase [Pseudomonas sp. S60]|uniref:oxidoreductase n=1 Tax=Pseudomonas sp. S60 TaxID=211124 RepID=UPI00191125A0|nr:oxidoreductase [Pseudomonas sp. S60]MBK5010885.1 SDR family NAD(P)-dependent oxidoreductase [Pseudomonas sp. S60]